MSATSPRTTLILGISGAFGGAMARVLASRGDQLVALVRDPARAATRKNLPPAIRFAKGDALNADDVAAAAKGADLIVHAVNPPGYKNWAGTVVPMLENSIRAARLTGARILLPGNIYNFHPDMGPLLKEHTPQAPATRKGQLRVAMEDRLREAANQGVKSLVIRAGDFFGPGTEGSWLAAGMITPGKPVTRIAYPGEPEAGHAWAYLPDLAEAAARLLDREDQLAPADHYHFPGHYCSQGIAFAEAIRRVTGGTAVIKGFPWGLVRLGGLFSETFRELREMRYLWQRPMELDGTKLEARIGAIPHTPLDQALAVTLESLGCLSSPLPAAVIPPVQKPASSRVAGLHHAA